MIQNRKPFRETDALYLTARVNLAGGILKQSRRVLSFLLCFFPFMVVAQQAGLESKLNELQRLVGEVKGEKVTYGQEAAFERETPFRLQFTVKETDSKGKSIERKAMLNLGMLDKNLIRWENSKDLMWVNLRSPGMSVIKVYKDGELDNYTDQLKIYSSDADNARAMETLLREIVPLAEKAWKESIALPKGLAELKSFISANVQDVNAGDGEFKQSLTADENYPSRLWLSVEEYTDKGLKKSGRLGFDPGDLSEQSVVMKIRGKKITVEAETRQKQDFITVEESGDLKGYGKSLSIYADDVDRAQLLVQSLKEAIPLAGEEFEKNRPQPTSLAQGFELLQSQVQPFVVGELSYEQSLSGLPVTTYINRTTNSKGNTEEKYIFDPGDLNEQTVNIKSSKLIYVVEAQTKGKESLIEVWKDGVQQKFSNQISFNAVDLPTAKKIQHLLRYTISAAQRTIDPKDLEWIRSTLDGVNQQLTGLQQSMATREGDDCKLAVTIQKEAKKGVDEHLLEFNLYDIDPEKVSMAVKGKTIELQLATKRGEEIVKDYHNGEKINYIKAVVFQIPDLETGKALAATFKKLAGECTK